mgnify:CR=1 FL=1
MNIGDMILILNPKGDIDLTLERGAAIGIVISKEIDECIDIFLVR